MRPLFALSLALTACAAAPVLLPDSGPCSSACGAGTVCSGGACVAVDGGAALDTGWPWADAVGDDRAALPDFGPRDTGFDAGVTDTGAIDAGAVDTGSDVPADVDPRQSEVCMGVLATCDGRTVNVQGGVLDGGIYYHCGGCGRTCAAGTGCLNCVCIPLN